MHAKNGVEVGMDEESGLTGWRLKLVAFFATLASVLYADNGCASISSDGCSYLVQSAHIITEVEKGFL